VSWSDRYTAIMGALDTVADLLDHELAPQVDQGGPLATLAEQLDVVHSELRALVERPDGAGLIAVERDRQQEVEAFTVTTDLRYERGELLGAAIAYLQAALFPHQYGQGQAVPLEWPPRWERVWWKPSDDPVRNLEKAGALVAADIDRRRTQALLDALDARR